MNCMDVASTELNSYIHLKNSGMVKTKIFHVKCFNIEKSILYIFFNPKICRYCWKHGITPRHSDIVPFSVLSSSSQYPEIQNLGIENQDRVVSNKGLTLVKRGTRMSLTFRRTMRGECKCRFPEFCNR